MTRASLAIGALSCALVASMAPPAASAPPGCAAGSDGGDWPSLNHDLSNSRNQPLEDRIGPENAGRLSALWSITLPLGIGYIDGTPAVADGCVYVATNFRTLLALNADTGDLVWQVALPGTMWSSPTVEDGRIFVHVNGDARETMALDQVNGEIVWRTVWDTQPNTYFFSSPVVFNGIVLSSLSAVVAEDQASGNDRRHIRGSYALLDADTGEILEQRFTIPDDDYAAGYSGVGLWSTSAVDPVGGYAYEGTGNTFTAVEHANGNAIVKIDVDPSRSTFGEIVDRYRGTADQMVDLGEKPGCYTTTTETELETLVYNNATCLLLDLDFGASPQLFEDDLGRSLVGAHQKSGIYHAVDTTTMDDVWTSVVGVPWLLGGASTASYDGDDGIYVPGSQGQLFALDKDGGDWRWAMPAIDTQTGGPPGTMHSQPATTANGVLYTIDGRGVFTAYDASTGVPLFVRPLAMDTGAQEATPAAGIAVARHKVYVPSGRTMVVYGLPEA